MLMYRIAECNNKVALTGVYEKRCLAQNFPETLLEKFTVEIQNCIDISFSTRGDFDSVNLLL